MYTVEITSGQVKILLVYTAKRRMIEQTNMNDSKIFTQTMFLLM